jgi:hypothetical protein
MSKKVVTALLCAALSTIASAGVRAMPVSVASTLAAKSDLILVRNFCGLGFHRSVYGYCVRNGAYPYPAPVYAAPVYAPPVYVVPPVVAPMACPYGYRIGPYGRCIPY